MARPTKEKKLWQSQLRRWYNGWERGDCRVPSGVSNGDSRQQISPCKKGRTKGESTTRQFSVLYPPDLRHHPPPFYLNQMKGFSKYIFLFFTHERQRSDYVSLLPSAESEVKKKKWRRALITMNTKGTPPLTSFYSVHPENNNAEMLCFPCWNSSGSQNNRRENSTRRPPDYIFFSSPLTSSFWILMSCVPYFIPPR